MANYDAGEVTDREKLAAKRQKALAKYNDNSLTGQNGYSRTTANRLANWNEGNQYALAQKNAARTRLNAEDSARFTTNEFNRSVDDYDFANRQNAALRDEQISQALEKNDAERSIAQQNLQNAALGLFGSMNQAMNGSTVGNAMHMLGTRNNQDNITYWQQLQDNINALNNSYNESYNQNQVAKRRAASDAIKALNDIESGLAGDLNNIQNDYWANLANIRGDLFSTLGNLKGDLITNRRNARADLAANLSNINPNLYEEPEKIKYPKGYTIPKGKKNVFVNDNIYKRPTKASDGISNMINTIRNARNGITENIPELWQYVMPGNAEQAIIGNRNTLRGNDYYSRLINGYNGR